MQTAAELKIQELYRYQAFNLDRLKQIIQENVLFLSNPCNFNDPWDCQPYFYSDVDNPRIKKAVIGFYVKSYEKFNPDGGGVDIHEAIKTLDADPDKLKAFMNKTSVGVAEDIDKQYRVCCLTTKPTCPLMWGHYAEKHTGVCLEFNVRNEVFCKALKIEYEENYPPFQLIDDAVETNVKALTTKSQDWSYEDEYRLIALDKYTNLLTDGMLVTDGNCYLFQKMLSKRLLSAA